MIIVVVVSAAVVLLLMLLLLLLLLSFSNRQSKLASLGHLSPSLQVRLRDGTLLAHASLWLGCELQRLSRSTGSMPTSWTPCPTTF